VRQGVLAAARVQGKGALPVMVYALAHEEKDAVANYEYAVAQGARIVIGPLTRAGANAIVARDAVSVPTLSLNPPDAGLPLPPRLYVLTGEQEARRPSRKARARGRLISPPTRPFQAYAAGVHGAGARRRACEHREAARRPQGAQQMRTARTVAPIRSSSRAMDRLLLRAFADSDTVPSTAVFDPGDPMTNNDRGRFPHARCCSDHPAVMIYRATARRQQRSELLSARYRRYRVSQTLTAVR
jgi:hypothetical protein